MQVLKSLVNPRSLAACLASAYDLSDVRCRLIKATMRDTYHVWSAEGHFVFSLYRHKAKTGDQILAELEIIDQVAASGLRTALSVRQLNGDRLLSLDLPEGMRFGALFRYLEGTQFERNPRPQLAIDLGRFTARLHESLADLPQSERRPVMGLDQLLDDSLLAIESMPDSGVTDQHVDYLRQMTNIIRQRLSTLLPEPAELVHNDLFPSNVLVSPSEELALVDFDLCSRSWSVLDIATYLNETAYWGAPALVGTSFLAGYEDIRRLRDWERAALPFLQAARFVWAIGVPVAMVNEWGGSYLHERILENHIAAIQRLVAGS